jgi:hypothetical protein
MRFEVLTAVAVKSTVTPCIPLHVCVDVSRESAGFYYPCTMFEAAGYQSAERSIL